MDWIKCLFGIHKWKVIGKRIIETYKNSSDEWPINAYDVFLYQCRKCGKLKEIRLNESYNYFEIDQQEEVEIED